MPTTTNSALRYPASSAAPNIPQDIQNLASDVDTAMPRGERSRAVRTTTAGPVPPGAGWTTVSGLSVSITLASSRRVMVTFQGQATTQTSGTIVGTRISNTTNNLNTAITQYIAVQNFGEGCAIIHRETLAAGTWTFIVQQAQFNGPGSAYLTADPATLSVSDAGPA